MCELQVGIKPRALEGRAQFDWKQRRVNYFMVHYVLDIQAFKRYLNRVVVKEVAIVALETDAQPSVFLFKPPFPWEGLCAEFRSSNEWLSRNFHGLSWEQGDIPYELVSQVLEKALVNSNIIYVKGLEKKQWVKEILPNKFVYNIENFRCPALRKLPPVEDFFCSNHALEGAVCAAHNVYKLRDYLLSRSVDEVD